MIKQLELFPNKIKPTRVGVFGLTPGLRAFYLLKTFQKIDSNMLLVVDSNRDINLLYNDLIGFTKDILTFPMDSNLIVDAEAISPEFMQERFDTLVKLQDKTKNHLVITSLEGFNHPVLDKSIYNDTILNLKVGNEENQEKIAHFLNDNMFERVSSVSQTGEYALRGHVLDIYLENYQNPIRIEFWGDEIDSMREFDPLTQRSLKSIDDIKIYPNPDCQVNNNNASIKDYVDGYNVIIDYPQINARFQELNQSLIVDDFNMFIFNVDSTTEIDCEKEYYNSEIITPFNGKVSLLEKFVNYKLENNFLVICALDTKSQIELITRNMNYKLIESIDEADYTKLNVIIKHLNNPVDFEDSKLVILNSEVIFNQTTVNRKYLNKFKFTQKIKGSDELTAGDYIVHEMHGIGKYEGIQTIDSNGIVKDFFAITYRDGDKLYVPINQIEMVQKYSSNSDFTPKLNKLGGVEWEKTKRKITNRMEEVAKKLLEIYAAREMSQGFACEEDSVDAALFESDFEFRETRDQLKAVNEIKADMEQTYPMDRLLCGDVGFGKTEVAFRAAFKAMDNSKQVAYLCPTTILSIQQYEEALKRFSNVPINIAILNRFTTTKQRTQILDDLLFGKIDFVFGTHSLLSDKVVFKDLGLLIVDEEQRFGVVHKEKIKEIKSDVDVLTLSATPIPRTLQMSLLGIRNMSVIDTAPVNRFPVQTYVIGYNEQIIKEAINNELARNGQVFILCSTITKQAAVKRLVTKLINNVTIEVVNGKMTKNVMEDIFYKFNNQEIDILVATTIIENGINVPNANTLIVLDADKFGLAQLYQIRGRVGRGETIAYAYLMYEPNKVLTLQARSRLEAIKKFTKLGSGFKIASRDLAIRGAGDILGAEQAGFIDTVGVELYMKLLKDIIDKKKSGDVEEISESKAPLIEYSNHIPNSYVTEDDVKLQIHKKIQSISDEATYEEVLSEINDVYGKVPAEIETYMNEVLFDVKVKSNHIIKIDQNKKMVKVLLNPVDIDGAAVLASINKIGRHFRMINKLNEYYLTIDITKTDDWQKDLISYIDFYND